MSMNIILLIRLPHLPVGTYNQYYATLTVWKPQRLWTDILITMDFKSMLCVKGRSFKLSIESGNEDSPHLCYIRMRFFSINITLYEAETTVICILQPLENMIHFRVSYGERAVETNAICILLSATWFMPDLWAATDLFCSWGIELLGKHAQHHTNINMNVNWQRDIKMKIGIIISEKLFISHVCFKTKVTART